MIRRSGARRAFLVAGLALASPSTAPAQRPAEPPGKPAPSAAEPARADQTPVPPAHPGIQSFDCASDDEMKRGESLRARRSGGPEGATWNWYGFDLVCSVVVRGACDGTGRVVLELGRKRVARAEIALSQKDATTQALRVPSRVWERALKRHKNLVYETLTLRVGVDVRCADGARRAPPQTWSDSFVGAFSGGE